MNLIDWRDARPIYEQITERIKRLILMDVLAPGEQLPSVRTLAMENSTNPNTVQKAYAELERQGYAYTADGASSWRTARCSRTNGAESSRRRSRHYCAKQKRPALTRHSYVRKR